MSLSAEQILEADDFGKPVRVEVPEWGGHVFVKIISGGERDKWELQVAEQMRKSGPKTVRAGLCVVCICDESGKRQFGDGQITALGAKSAVALDRVFEVAKTLNKIDDSDVEDLEKNS